MSYSAKIIETSKELTKKEKVNLKDTTAAIKIDEATKEGAVIIYPAFYGILEIHNDKATPEDYENYIVVDKGGDKYVTGSQSFWSAFKAIADEMEGEEEEWGVKVYRLPSKNYTGRDFLTCCII